MERWWRAFWTPAILLAALGAHGPAAGAGGLPSELVACGQSLDHSLRFANNLKFCPGNGVVVANDNIVIDLAGHRIGGSGVSNGIDNSGGHVGVVIANGVVSGFDVGVFFLTASGGTIQGIQALENVDSGIRLNAGSQRNRLTGNTVSTNTGSGIVLSASSDNVLMGNAAAANGQHGILLASGSSRNTLRANTATGNVSAGIRVESLANDNTLKGNRTVNNPFYGVELDSVSGTRLLGNVSTGNGSYGITVSGASASTLKKNTVSGNDEAGIVVESSSNTILKRNNSSANSEEGIFLSGGTNNVLTGNVANENRYEGIYSLTADLTLIGNTANHNGFVNGVADGKDAGIDVPLGTTNSKNRAEDNDDPSQCLASDVSCFVP
jgi:parallel beta-helix repeat protein